MNLPDTPTLSVIIVNWNTKRLLLQCVQSIMETADSVTHEILVVDNNSTDDSVGVVRSSFPRVRLIVNEHNLGFSKAANLAISHTRGAYILIAHPDVCFQTGAISELVSWLQEHKDSGVVGANLIYPDGTFNKCAMIKRNLRHEVIEFGFPLNRMDEYLTLLYRKLGLKREPIYWDHMTTAESASVWNACMMFKREVFADIGLFDESFFNWFADTDWCYRARKDGWGITYLSSPIVVHYELQSGSFLDGSEVGYKVDASIVNNPIRKDLEILYRKHYGSAYRMMGSGLRRLFGLKKHVIAHFHRKRK